VPLLTHSATHRTRVWDLPTRIFHWALVLCVLISVNIDQIQWHFRFGYAGCLTQHRCRSVDVVYFGGALDSGPGRIHGAAAKPTKTRYHEVL
jgi:hypothetical protein